MSDFTSPMLEGTQPEKLLLAITTTVAGVDPMFSGILEEKRLLFINIASKLLLKSAGGNSPSKLLNLRSMYLSSVSSSTCSGNRPTKRLLLKSSSYRILRLVKLFGTIPQNLLEFICRSARSVNRPTSGGM